MNQYPTTLCYLFLQLLPVLCKGIALWNNNSASEISLEEGTYTKLFKLTSTQFIVLVRTGKSTSWGAFNVPKDVIQEQKIKFVVHKKLRHLCNWIAQKLKLPVTHLYDLAVVWKNNWIEQVREIEKRTPYAISMYRKFLILQDTKPFATAYSVD
jgi:hypothetical protein